MIVLLYLDNDLTKALTKSQLYYNFTQETENKSETCGQYKKSSRFTNLNHEMIW